MPFLQIEHYDLRSYIIYAISAIVVSVCLSVIWDLLAKLLKRLRSSVDKTDVQEDEATADGAKNHLEPPVRVDVSPEEIFQRLVDMDNIGLRQRRVHNRSRQAA